MLTKEQIKSNLDKAAALIFEIETGIDIKSELRRKGFQARISISEFHNQIMRLSEDEIYAPVLTKEEEKELDGFIRHYIIAALWATNDDKGEPLDKNYDITDLSDDANKKIRQDCIKFLKENKNSLEIFNQQLVIENYHNGESPLEIAAHNFFLSRNGHGSGFFDEEFDDKGLKYILEELQDYCRKFGEINFYVGDDGKIYC